MSKIGETMNEYEVAKNIIVSAGGVAKTSMFVAQNFTTYDVATLYEKGYIEKVRHGFYKLPDEHIEDEVILKAVMPEAVICVESALFYHGYSDYLPRKHSIAVPRTVSVKKINNLGLDVKVYYIPSERYAIGKTEGDFNGVILSVYDKERTICDCFKYRTKLDSEMFNQAVNAYVADENKHLANLAKYAKEMGLYSKIMDIMGVLIDGR